MLDLLNRTVLTLAAFGGLAVESMTRGEGWRFLDMGRKLERSLHTIAPAERRRSSTRPPQEGPVLDAVLEVADSWMTYRRRYLSSLQAAAVLDLLVLDETNPRSLASQLVGPGRRRGPPAAAGPAGRPGPGAAATLCGAEPGPTGRAGEAGGHVRTASGRTCRRLLDESGDLLPALSDSITQQYLSHLQTSRHLAAAG